MSNITVGIGELNVASFPVNLHALGLGSCVGLMLYDPVTKTGGLAHIMLPESNNGDAEKRGKYADTAIVDLYNEMLKRSVKKENIKAKIVGGASMFNLKNDVLKIGEKNIYATKEALKKLGIPVSAEETGGIIGRTVFLNTGTGEVEIKTVNQQLKKI